MPNSEEIAHADIFIGTKFHRHNLKYIHMWGYPVYVLDPTLQQGCKLPKRQTQYCRTIFVGFSTNHSSDVTLILNPATGHIYPQFHVIFDDYFITVLYLSPEEEPPYLWNEFDLGDFIYQVNLNDNT